MKRIIPPEKVVKRIKDLYGDTVTTTPSSYHGVSRRATFVDKEFGESTRDRHYIVDLYVKTGNYANTYVKSRTTMRGFMWPFQFTVMDGWCFENHGNH